MGNVYNNQERRQFFRLDYATPLRFKVCKKETLSQILQGYTVNISQAGLLCNIKEKVQEEDILWLSFDRAILHICEELEKKAFIHQNGIIGKVVRITHKDNNEYDIGIKFITREEKNLTHIYPEVYFLEKSEKNKDEQAKN